MVTPLGITIPVDGVALTEDGLRAAHDLAEGSAAMWVAAGSAEPG